MSDSCSRGLRQQFASRFTFRLYNKGAVIIQQGDSANEFYIMCKGIAEVYLEKRPVSPQATAASLEQVTLTDAPSDLPSTPRMLVPSDVPAQDADLAQDAAAPAAATAAAAAVPKDAKKEVRLLIVEYQHSLRLILFHFSCMHVF